MIYYNQFGHAGYAPWHSRTEYNQQSYQHHSSGYYSSERPGSTSGYHTVPQSPVPTFYQPCSLNYLSRARCSAVKQSLDAYPGVKSSSLPPASQPGVDQYSPAVLATSWEEKFCDLSEFISQSPAWEMAVSSSDEAVAASSQAAAQRIEPDVFFGSDLGVSPDIALDTIDLPREGKVAPGLKLNVDTRPVDFAEPDALDTPDMIWKDLDNVKSFNIMDYVFSEEKKPSVFNEDIADPCSSFFRDETDPSLTPSTGKIFGGHESYGGKTGGGTTVQGKYFGDKTLPTLSLTGKSLPTCPAIEKKKPLPDNNNRNANTQGGPKLKQIATVRPQRLKLKKFNEDFVYDRVSTGKRSHHLLSTVTVKEEEDSDAEMCFDNSFNFANHSNNGTKKRLLTLPPRCRLTSGSSTSSSFSSQKPRDDDIVGYESGKYRELRNRNNEASRRSRANRKERERRMKEESEKLIVDNARLKRKYEQLERDIKKYRSSLMNMVTSNKRSSAGS